MTLKTVSWKTWLGIAVIIFLLIVIFGKCNTDQPVKVVQLQVPDKALIKAVDAYRDTVELYRKQIEQSKLEKQGTEKLLKKADVNLKGLIAKYNKAVQDANVPAIRETCDSLVLENTQLFEQIGQYQTDMNELVDYYELALKASDSASCNVTTSPNFTLSPLAYLVEPYPIVIGSPPVAGSEYAFRLKPSKDLTKSTHLRLMLIC